MRSNSGRVQRGFTLVELVVSIGISAIVLVFVTLFIKPPMDAYFSQARRAELIDSASSAWRPMLRDIQAALPNSARSRVNGNIKVLEVLTVVDAVRYTQPPSGASFTTAGVFRVAHPFGPTGPGAFYLSVDGGTGMSPYALGGVMTPANRSITIVSGPNAGEDVVTVTPAFAFGPDSPRNYVYLVSGPVTYLCNQPQGTVTRFSGYSIAANQASRDTAGELNGAGAASTLVARNITACDFQVSAGNSHRGQVVTARITATRDTESAVLLHQAAVEKLQ